MTSIVRRASEADLPRIIQLLAQLDPGDPGREDLRSPLPGEYMQAFREIESSPGLSILVVEDAGKITGTLALLIVPNLSHRASPYAIVENVVVDENARSKGYGAALIQHAVEKARKAGCYKVSLTSNKRRQEAHLFYRRLGFEATHEGFRMTL